MLAGKLGWPRYYMGELRRQAAFSRGMDLAQYNKLGETDPSTDKEVDVYQENLGKSEDNFIIEGRTSWYFIPHSLKIYLYVDKEVGAKRIFANLQVSNERNEGANLDTWQQVLLSNEKRVASDTKRYQSYYGIDVDREENYDLYLDTSKLNIEQVYQQVEDFVYAKLKASK